MSLSDFVEEPGLGPALIGHHQTAHAITQVQKNTMNYELRLELRLLHD